MAKLTIYQSKEPSFFVNKEKKVYNKADYRKVYSTTVMKYCGNPAIEHIVLLEMLFEDFNIGPKPESYKGHSLSVGDIVEIDHFLYICSNFGWKEIEWEK